MKDGKGRITLIKNEYFESGRLEAHYYEKNYWNVDELILKEVLDFTRPDYYTKRRDTFIYNNKHQIIEQTTKEEGGYSGGFHGTRNLYYYSSNGNYSITHFSLSSPNGIT